MAAHEEPATGAEQRLTHVDETGAARMVDVSAKDVTRREAVATGRVLTSPEVVRLLRGEGVPKGDALGVARVAVVALTVVSLALIPAITATVVDALVKLRLQREAGGLYDPIDGHTVVVGLGDLGTRIIRALHNEGVDVVAIERDHETPGVQIARDLKIPVIIGDASRSESLDPSILLQPRQSESGGLIERLRFDVDAVTDPRRALERDRAKP